MANYEGCGVNMSCELCSLQYGRIEKHHIIKRRYFGSDDMKNLVNLCYKCHRKLDSFDDRVSRKIINFYIGKKGMTIKCFKYETNYCAYIIDMTLNTLRKSVPFFDNMSKQEIMKTDNFWRYVYFLREGDGILK